MLESWVVAWAEEMCQALGEAPGPSAPRRGAPQCATVAALSRLERCLQVRRQPKAKARRNEPTAANGIDMDGNSVKLCEIHGTSIEVIAKTGDFHRISGHHWLRQASGMPSRHSIGSRRRCLRRLKGVLLTRSTEMTCRDTGAGPGEVSFLVVVSMRFQ